MMPGIISLPKMTMLTQITSHAGCYPTSSDPPDGFACTSRAFHSQPTPMSIFSWGFCGYPLPGSPRVAGAEEGVFLGGNQGGSAPDWSSATGDFSRRREKDCLTLSCLSRIQSHILPLKPWAVLLEARTPGPVLGEREPRSSRHSF